MTALDFKIRLLSDAMLSSGLGTEIVDSLITRDSNGTPIIRGSHIKGLMRQTLTDSLALLGYGSLPFASQVFGSSPREDEDFGAVFSIGQATADVYGESLMSTRTRINEFGVADEGSLRTNEMVPVGSVFHGTCFINAQIGTVEDIAVRFSLMAIDAVGGSRTRGAGQCVVEIIGETRSPGELLKLLKHFLGSGLTPRSFDISRNAATLLRDECVLFRVDFVSDSPVCCPENPVKTNLLSTGFSIPASALQGVILHKINAVKPDLASACFEDSRFRAWPLQPIVPNADTSVRVSLTHKVDKNASVLPNELKKHWFEDEAVNEDWRLSAPGAPLKSRDGVLMTLAGNQVLWQSSSMPRVVSIHNSVGSKHDGLFAMESMAPGHWTGFLHIPAEAAEVLEQLVSENPRVFFGKRRSVQGGGNLHLARVKNLPRNGQLHESIIIIQSPVLLDELCGRSLEEGFMTIASSWAKRHGLPEPIRVWADAGILYGWNRHRLGNTIGKQSRLEAIPAVLPGSVIKFQQKLDDSSLDKALIQGIGSARERGFGSALKHPGIAVKLHSPERSLGELSSPAKDAFRIAAGIAKRESLPSASQISALLSFYEDGGIQEAIDYLERQKQRGKRYWSDWEENFDSFRNLLEKEGANRALRYLVNSAHVRRKGEA